MRRLVREEKIDLIHSHLPDQNFYSCLVGRLTGRRVVATYHGIPGLAGNRKGRGAVKSWIVRQGATAIVVVSDYLARVLTEFGFPAEKIVRIYNGVNVDKFASAARGRLRAELGFPEYVKLIGMVANFRESKGYEYFIQAARQVADAHPEARFVAIGEKDECITRRLESQIVQLHLEGLVVLLGFRTDVPQVLKDLDVFVLSSVSEGLSIATIEAMAAGKPVVVTRSGGPEEVVDDGRTGLLVPIADPGALAAKIGEVLWNPTLAASLGRQGAAEAQNRFSLPRMVQAYESLYERCLSTD
jgi:glycosyltransferase involved in cell wall biosynthesis